MNRGEIRKMIIQLNLELKNAVSLDDTENTLRCMFGLGILKDALLESYGETYATNAVGSVITSNVQVPKNRSTNLAGPLRVAK
jgi:hypothetical protein